MNRERKERRNNRIARKENIKSVKQNMNNSARTLFIADPSKKANQFREM